MEESEVSYRQSILEALEVLKGSWTVALLAELALGQVQYKDLLEKINDFEARSNWKFHDRPLTGRTLTDTLQRARDAGLVERLAGESQFKGVWYKLTPLGQSLLLALRPLATWAQEYREEMARLQRP
ncbi:winged helix-turn-helix transcriptional regulator [Kibdelosporangium aridum]|uniref:winged helix-turn-helix transcriptional regulator n=1 Tax=Kibdelosporangium aridum TaxID=2030 RepID=UPI0006923720